MSISLIIADEQELFRKGVISILNNSPGLKILGEASNGEEVIELTEKAKPDILLLDLKMPALNGYDVLTKIKKQKAKIKCIILSMHIDEDSIGRAFEMGAAGFLSKAVNPQEVIIAIQRVAETGFYFDDRSNRAMAYWLAEKRKITPDFDKTELKFSEKEVKIIQLLAKEMSNAEIAELFYLSPRTIETIRQHLIRKVGVKNVIGLILFAAKCGLIEV